MNFHHPGGARRKRRLIATICFDKPGPSHTDETLRLALKAAQQRHIDQIVTPSNTGATAMKLADAAWPGLSVVCVSHVYGFAGRPGNDMPEETRQALTSRGICVVTAAHALSGAERALSGAFGGVYPVEIIAHTLRMLGQGVKVAVEVAAMACDAGFVQPGRAIIALGGTGSGVDTAIILRPQPTHRLMETRIDELLAKPLVP